MTRKAEIKRKTSETDIALKLMLECTEKWEINTGVGFFDHMLGSMSKHGRFSLELNCKGDYEVDAHHTVEDTGICLGKAFKKALGDLSGVARFGDASVPMDDSLAKAVVDLSGRAFFKYTGKELKGFVGDYDSELTIEFLRAFATNAQINLHVSVIYGENNHHIQEAVFKALGIALYKAAKIDEFLQDNIQSTKGSLYDNGD
ncbi:MAG: imidazoleglycerol-phosphate dehydratase HisB [Spirochaetes bacterium]|nr:imidazoleglycerol-phosphate dehydratase HisB [Spirochaetota bacterium]